MLVIAFLIGLAIGVTKRDTNGLVLGVIMNGEEYEDVIICGDWIGGGRGNEFETGCSSMIAIFLV